MNTKLYQTNPEDVLSRVFGHDSFRPGQKSIVDAILHGQDVVAVLPTGAGKSLCYQLPALLLPGLTLVISPLIALMNNQVRALRKKGIAAEALHSSLPPGRRRAILQRAVRGDLKLLYLSPERFVSAAFQPYLEYLPIRLICVDEAHCLPEWGDDFRPAYREIGSLLRSWPTGRAGRPESDVIRSKTGAGRPDKHTDRPDGTTRPPVCALTASATPAIRAAISKRLGLVNPFTRIFSFDRPNLFFGVLHAENKIRCLLDILPHYQADCGIIYCQTRQSVNALTRLLNREGFPALSYHAGLAKDDREKNQTAWMSGSVRIIVATNAFGMGIDKPDVRFVIHFQMPGSMMHYYQEAGRAGRDGKSADCLMLIDESDLRIQDSFLRRDPAASVRRAASSPRGKKLEDLHGMMIYAGGRSCLRASILRCFGETPAFGNCGFCSACLEAGSGGGSVSSDEGPFRLRTENRSPIPEEDPALFHHLKSTRSRLIRRQKRFFRVIPPIALFPESVLHDMARLQPTSLLSLMTLPDISPVQAIRWGRAFLREIRIWKMM